MRRDRRGGRRRSSGEREAHRCCCCCCSGEEHGKRNEREETKESELNKKLKSTPKTFFRFSSSGSCSAACSFAPLVRPLGRSFALFSPCKGLLRALLLPVPANWDSNVALRGGAAASGRANASRLLFDDSNQHRRAFRLRPGLVLQGVGISLCRTRERQGRRWEG